MNYQERAEILKAVAHYKRILILTLISEKPDLSIINICDKLNEDIKNVSFHVAKLSSAGLLTKRKSGNFVNLAITGRGKTILTFVRMLE